MTLNLMLTSRDAVYLSGDFRLVALDRQAPLPDSYDTQKLIPVIRHEWSALVAYMGIQSAPPLIADMGQWLAEQIDALSPDAPFSELSTRLLALNRWLGSIHGDRRVAISVVGFRDRRPFMTLLSNFLDLQGRVSAAGPQLHAYSRTPTQPEVRSAGTRGPDVFERVRLVRMMQANASRGVVPRMIRQAVAEINASVARRSNGSISEACVSGFLLRSGAAAIGGHGIPEHAACFPNWLQRDLERGGITAFASLASVDRMTPVQWRGTTARVVSDTTQRTHHLANAGAPLLDGLTRPGGAPTWTVTETGGTRILSITLDGGPA